MASIRPSAPEMFAAGAIWPPVCAFVVTMRFMTRRAQRAKIGIDDWLVLLALILVTGIGVAVLAGTALKSLGYPTPVQAPDTSLSVTSYQQTVTRKIFWAVLLMQTTALGFIKLSCLFFYRRIFRTGGTKAVDFTLHSMIGIIIIWTISYLFAYLFACGTHFEYFWTSLENQSKCASAKLLDDSLSISDVIIDVILILFPMPLVWRLQMSTARKLAVMGIFSLAALSIAASVARMVIILQGQSVQYAMRIDQDLLSSGGIYFMIHEAGLGLCAICLPTLAGSLKLKSVQTIFHGFQSLFSFTYRSRESFRASKHPQIGSQGSNSKIVIHGSRPSDSLYDVEMEPVRSNNDIHVTSAMETTIHTA